MRCEIAGPLPTAAHALMRHFGYAEHHTVGMGLTFIRNAHEAAFPRFHAVVREAEGGGLVLNIHLDQASFNAEGNHRFVWAYKNPHLDSETKRILAAVDTMKRRLAAGEHIEFDTTPIKEEHVGFIGKLFRIM